MVFEYEDVLLRPGMTSLSSAEVGVLLDYLCKVGHLQRIFYLWRPLLSDPKDDMLLELAVAAGCRSIITYNARGFAGAERFGVSVLEPRTFLSAVGVFK